MKKGSLEKKRKYSFLLVIAVCALFLTVLFLTYRFSAADTATYFVVDDTELALVSVSPDNESGISEDSQIVIQWNHGVSSKVGEDIKINPSVRGTWSASGNKLIFTPQHFAAGTYYTVYIPSGTSLNNAGDVLKDDVYFSFETENPGLRIPDTKSFSVGANQYRFATDDSVAIPVSCIAADDFDVDVTVYRAEDSKAFIASFAELFAYPSWAQLTIGQFQAGLRNFEQISQSAMSVQQKNGSSSVVLGSLPPGQYLVRMAAADSSYDVAVTVSDIDSTVFYDGANLNVWCHQGGKTVEDGWVTVDGKKYALDENGFVSLPYGADKRRIHDDPTRLALTISTGDEDFVYFVPADKLTMTYTSSLALNETNFIPGDDLTVSGAIAGSTGNFDDDMVTLNLCSANGVLETKTVKTENGCFSYTWGALPLSDGDYSVRLLYQGKEQTSAAFQVDTAPKELYLSVKTNVDTVFDGGEVSYTVAVKDINGNGVDRGTVTMNGMETKEVNHNGVAFFSKSYVAGDGLSVVQKDAVFSIDSPYGNADKVTASVAVVSDRPFMEIKESDGEIYARVYHYTLSDGVLEKEKDAENRILIAVYKDGEMVTNSISPEKTVSYSCSWDQAKAGQYTLTASAGNAAASLQKEISGENKESLGLILEDNIFRPVEEGESPSYTLDYEGGTYDAGTGAALYVTAPLDLTSENGKNIVVGGSVDGADLCLTVISLYRGMLSPAAAGRDFYGESLGYAGTGVLEENRVFFGDAQFSAAFSAENRDGHYFVRIWSEAADGTTVSRYLPVTVDGVTLNGAYDPCFAVGSKVNLPFHVTTDTEISYTLTLNDDLVFTGETDKNFQVETDIAAVGNYSGTLVLSQGKKVMASLPVSFSVYEPEPVFYEVIKGYDKNAKLVYEVDQEDGDAAAVLFQQALAPGDQIHQQMSKALLYSALGDDAGYLAQDIDDNLLPLQNSDGGFGRYPGAESDLFLSVLVAGTEDFIYDTASLKSYLSYRLTAAEDGDAAALACWGLSCFDLGCGSSMAEIADDNSLTKRGQLYLAEGYLAAGDHANAEKIYRHLQNDLAKEGNQQYLPDSDQQSSIVNTAFMLDLAIKTDQAQKHDLLSYLLGADIQSQTGRYLLELCILSMIDTDEIVLTTTDQGTEGKTFLSLKGTDQKLDLLDTKFFVDGKAAATVNAGDIAKIQMSWEDEENSIYLIYIISGSNVSVIKKDGMTAENGHLEFITAENTAGFEFKPTKAGDAACFIYVVNMTTGEPVGYANISGIEVRE